MALVLDLADGREGRAEARRRPALWTRLVGRAAPPPAASPWGAILAARDIAPGLTWFRTAARGGYRLSPRRQRAVPRALRTPDGWYEDSTEWAAVAVVFDRLFDALPAPSSDSGATLYRMGKETLKQWRPEEYESWFETTLSEAEIDGLAVMRLYRANADRWIAFDSGGAAPKPDADGRFRVRAGRGGDPPYGACRGRRPSPARWFLVDGADWTRGRGRPFLIDQAIHRETDEPA